MRFNSCSFCVEVRFLIHVEKFLTPFELKPENDLPCQLAPLENNVGITLAAG